MRDSEELRANCDRAAQLFLYLPRKAGSKRFAGLTLPAWKLPQPLEMDPVWATGDEKAPISLDDSGGDDNDPDSVLERHTAGEDAFCASARCEHAVRIGHVGHLGLRAVQSVAPKSISA